MTDWSVAVTVGGFDGGEPLQDHVAAIALRLTDLAPAFSLSPGVSTVRIAVEGGDVEEAIARALGAVRDALHAVGWPAEIRAVEATEWSLFEEHLAEPTYPELVGVTEIADLLGTSRQRASELARSPRFPAPLADLAAGPVWLMPTVARFVEEWDRKPGRPRSSNAAHVDEDGAVAG